VHRAALHPSDTAAAFRPGDDAGLRATAGVRARLAAVLAGDGRRGRGVKAGLRSRDELVFYELFRALVALATDPAHALDGVTRRTLAAELGVPFKTFEKWLSLTEDQHPRWSVVCVLLAREDLVPASAAMEIKGLLAREWGLVVGSMPPPASELRGEGGAGCVRSAALAVSAGVGRVAAAVHEATSPDGDGGTAITPAEAAAIVPPAMEVHSGVEELLGVAVVGVGTGGSR
jgi:hypothetical protein